MARLFTAGAETGDVSEWTAGDFGVSSSTNEARLGTRSFRLNPVTDQAFAFQMVAGSDQVIAGFARVYVKIIETPDVDITLLRFVNYDLSATVCSIKVTTSLTLQLIKQDGSQLGSDSAVLSLDTWYAVELMNDSSVSGDLEARIDSVSFASGANSSSGFWACLVIGDWDTSSTFDIYFDAIAFNDDTGSSPNNTWAGLALDQETSDVDTGVFSESSEVSNVSISSLALISTHVLDVTPVEGQFFGDQLVSEHDLDVTAVTAHTPVVVAYNGFLMLRSLDRTVQLSGQLGKGSFANLARTTRVGVLDIVGQSKASALTQVRGGIASAFSILLMDNESDVITARSLFATGSVLQFRLCPEPLLVNAWVSVLDVVETRLAYADWARKFDVNFILTDKPL